MDLKDRIIAFTKLGQFIGQFGRSEFERDSSVPSNNIFFDDMAQQLELAKTHNGWFTSENLRFACENWSNTLTKDTLESWIMSYNLPKKDSKTVGVIMAGNIPLVGFHDFLSVLITGNKILVKLASGDQQLLPLLSNYLIAVEPRFNDFIEFTEQKLEKFDAVIATGSTNTARYFDYYFGKYPNIIRKNRNSIAIISGNEDDNQLKLLGNDIFRYFGLGCRNVSKIYVPNGYNFDAFFKAMYLWKEMIYNNKYMNNYDYNKAVYLMSNIELLDNEFLLLKEDQGFSSPIAVVFYEYYDTIDILREKLALQEELIQCIVSANDIVFGKTQTPQLWDYADSVDTINFLLEL